MDLGLVAPLIVDPAGPEPFPFDREYTLVLDDWATGTGRPLASTAEGTSGGRGGMGGMMGGTGMMGRGMMGSDVWTINGKRYPRTGPLRVRRGDRVRARLRNMSMEAHPMHLHGQSFRLLAVDGRRLDHPVVKDSVDVGAHMGSVVVEFTAHNPGDWFFHRHKPMHMDGGMIVLARIA